MSRTPLWEASSKLPLSWVLTLGSGEVPSILWWVPYESLLPIRPALVALSWIASVSDGLAMGGTHWHLPQRMQEGVFPLGTVGRVGFLCFSSN